MESLFSGQLVGILVAVLGVLLIAYMRQGKKDQDSVTEAYLLDMRNATGQREFKIDQNLTTIGRLNGKSTDICIARNTISEAHAQIEYRNGNF